MGTRAAQLADGSNVAMDSPREIPGNGAPPLILRCTNPRLYYPTVRGICVATPSVDCGSIPTGKPTLAKNSSTGKTLLVEEHHAESRCWLRRLLHRAPDPARPDVTDDASQSIAHQQPNLVDLRQQVAALEVAEAAINGLDAPRVLILLGQDERMWGVGIVSSQEPICNVEPVPLRPAWSASGSVSRAPETPSWRSDPA